LTYRVLGLGTHVLGLVRLTLASRVLCLGTHVLGLVRLTLASRVLGLGTQVLGLVPSDLGISSPWPWDPSPWPCAL